MSYSPGDWVVLGKAGKGWPPELCGIVVCIADIGDHLDLLYDDYDFYVNPINWNLAANKLLRHRKEEQIENPNLGGSSVHIARKALAYEYRDIDAIACCLKL